MRFFVLFVFSLATFGCGPQSEAEIFADKISQSVKLGDDAANAKPPHGFALYPGAKITSSVMNGSSLGIETKADKQALVEYYVEQLSSQGYRVESNQIKDGKSVLTGVLEDHSGTKMVITVVPKDGRDDKFTLVFLRKKMDEGVISID